MYNHIGHFTASGEALCKALFFGGVTRRFPGLKFAFLEGGVGWACSLLSDLVSHWRKRNRAHMHNYDPANLDEKLLQELFAAHGVPLPAGWRDQMPISTMLAGWCPQDPALLDEWAACRIEREEDIRELFVPNFYFGCEGDDPINAWAFNART